MHPAQLPEAILLTQTDVKPLRTGGPGGQHRNRNATGVLLIHKPSGVKASATERRSRKDNHREALLRLRKKLAIEQRTPPGERCPSELWESRLRSRRIKVNPNHSDFPALLAELLDLLMHEKDDLQIVAKALGTSASQLVRLLSLEPKALANLNARRHQAGLKPLRSS